MCIIKIADINGGWIIVTVGGGGLLINLIGLIIFAGHAHIGHNHAHGHEHSHEEGHGHEHSHEEGHGHEHSHEDDHKDKEPDVEEAKPSATSSDTKQKPKKVCFKYSHC